MKKSKITSIIMSVALCMMLCVSLLAGCTLVTKDMYRYYNATVASFTYTDAESEYYGQKVEVNKRELITAFNSYGYQYYQNYGMDIKEAYKQTIERIIEQKLTIKSAEAEARKVNDGKVLSTKEKTYLWERTYQSIENNIKSYYNDLNGIRDDQAEDSSDKSVAANTFTPAAELKKDENGKYYIALTSTTVSEVDKYECWNGQDRDIENPDDLEALYNYVTAFIKDNPIYPSAFNKYLSEAKKSEEGMKLSTDNKSVFKRELERVYGVLYDSFMVTKYSETHQSANSPVTIANMLSLYQNKVVNDFNKYETENASGYDDAVLSDVSKLNYYKTTGTKFFYVSHILAKFDDAEQAEYDKLKKIVNLEENDGSMTVGEAQAAIDQLYANLTFKVREQNEAGTEWTENGETANVADVLDEVKRTLATAADDEYLKAELFDQLIYKYNQDDGVFNSSRNYVIGIDYSTPDTEKGTTYTIHSQMVEPFTNAAIALYNNGQAKIGDVYAELIKTDFGVHIMVYEGKVTNMFDVINANFNPTEEDLAKLTTNEARLKAGQKKTIFDSLYEQLNTDRYSIFENMNLQVLRGQVKIEFYPDEYKDLTK